MPSINPSIPSARLAPLRRGTPSPTPPVVLAGVGGLVLLVPADEALPGSQPPVPPSIASAASSACPARLVRGADGSPRALALATTTRARWSVAWKALTQAQAAALIDWLDLEVNLTERYWTLYPDGLDGEAVTVRLLNKVQVRQVARTGLGVWQTDEVEVEEVL